MPMFSPSEPSSPEGNLLRLRLLAIASFIIHYLGLQGGQQIRSFTQDSDYPSLVCSREMRPVAFLDPSAFVGTNLEALFPDCQSSWNCDHIEQSCRRLVL